MSSSFNSTPSRTPSPGPQLRAIRAKRFAANVEDYNVLIEKGGRPAFPLEMSRADYNEGFGEHAAMIDYWSQSFFGQRRRWTRFLNYQQYMRRSMETFTKYQQAVHDHRKTEGIDSSIHLHFDMEQQSKVDQWKEYHYFHHRHLPNKREKAEAARQKRAQQAKDWHAGIRDPSIPEYMGCVYEGETKAESHLPQYMNWIRWIEGELPKIEQECVESGNKGGVDASYPAEQGDEAKEYTGSPLVHAQPVHPSTEKHLRKSRRLTSRTKKPTTSLGVIGAPRVSSRKGTKPAVSAKHLSHADLGTATSSAPPDQSAASKKRATGKDVLTNPSRNKRSRLRNSSTRPTAETGSLRRSQRIIDMAARKAREQAVPETASSNLAVPQVQIRREVRAQQVKRKSKRAPLQRKPQGITKSQPSGRRRPQAAKMNVLAKEIMV
ncbi:hypothetical protein AJ78_03895 [Emergomyces pasteurianus Ep9510]|uniref:Uncharacterized protein n=1 Tax=Emergomyces pasteurianus Ep9510 TaxID=1447872 RepID=A0A1J9QL00_9EURO|nr:hypothetical protein AJ78_03895 [Emergomyces pasteurianus Ep9510]